MKIEFTVEEFTERFIQHNSLVRLVYKDKGGFQNVLPDDKVFMDHQLKKSEYANRAVIGIKDIFHIGSSYVEAINLVIAKE